MMPTPPNSCKQAEELLKQITPELVDYIQTIIDRLGFGSIFIQGKKGGIEELGMQVTNKPRRKHPE